MKRTGFWIGLVLMAAIAGGTLSYRPWKAYWEQRRITLAQREALEKAEARKAELARERARLESRVGREQKVRQHSYVRPGEESAG